MGYVLCQLPFQVYLFFFLSDIIDRNLKAGILKDDTFHDKGSSVFIDCDRHSLFIFSSRTLSLVLVDEVDDLFQFADSKDFFRSFQVGV